MNQQSYQAITMMLNGFPQSQADLRALLLTYELDLVGISDQAIQEAAQRFRRGEVVGQSRKFAPSIAEFVQEARRIESLIPYRNRTLLAARPVDNCLPQSKEDRERMGFKLKLLSEGYARSQADKVGPANKAGIGALVALASEWGVPIPAGVARNLSAS